MEEIAQLRVRAGELERDLQASQTELDAQRKSAIRNRDAADEANGDKRRLEATIQTQQSEIGSLRQSIRKIQAGQTELDAANRALTADLERTRTSAATREEALRADIQAREGDAVALMGEIASRG